MLSQCSSTDYLRKMILIDTMSQNSMSSDCCEGLMFIPGYSPRNTPTLAECCLINTCFNIPCFIDYAFDHACTAWCGADHLSEACVQNSCICGCCLLYGSTYKKGSLMEMEHDDLYCKQGSETWFSIRQWAVQYRELVNTYIEYVILCSALMRKSRAT